MSIKIFIFYKKNFIIQRICSVYMHSLRFISWPLIIIYCNNFEICFVTVYNFKTRLDWCVMKCVYDDWWWMFDDVFFYEQIKAPTWFYLISKVLATVCWKVCWKNKRGGCEWNVWKSLDLDRNISPHEIFKSCEVNLSVVALQSRGGRHETLALPVADPLPGHERSHSVAILRTFLFNRTLLGAFATLFSASVWSYYVRFGSECYSICSV